MEKKVRLLFVCLGNIVRSPLAENMFRSLIKENQVDGKYDVDSAGLDSWHVGEHPDARMVETALRHGLKYTGKAKLVTFQDLQNYDLVLAMDQSNLTRLIEKSNNNQQIRQKIHMLREFDPQGGPSLGVPDPYYGGFDDFEDVYKIVERSCSGLFYALENGFI